MIISFGRGYVFVHIPKTGGTSLAAALEQRVMKDDILLGDTPKARRRRHRAKTLNVRGRLWKHSTLADVDGVVRQDQRQDLFAFTLVRNPWDRAVSYYHWLKVQSFDHPAVSLAKTLDFEPFVLHRTTRQSFAATPARSYMTWPDGVEQCQAYIRLEHFEQDAQPLFDHLGFKPDMPHLNPSNRGRDYRAYYTEQSRKAVESACAEDIQRFGYGFDLPY